MAEDWWNPQGQFKPLHKFNPTRLAYIRDKLCAHFDRDPHAEKPLQASRVGYWLRWRLAERTDGAARGGCGRSRCGGSQYQNCRSACQAARFDIDYRAITAEQLVVKGETFDAILNMEVIEHVADPQAFMTLRSR